MLDPLSMPAESAFSVHHLGHEREPLVMIDDFTGQVEQLAKLGRQIAYGPVEGYPGVRSRVSSTYFAPRALLLRQILAEHFDLPRGAKVESCAFSIVSKRAEELNSEQRRPHYDGAEADVVALLHFTGDAATGGTAFYRHRSTGFETIRPERVQRYEVAVIEEERRYGPYPARYFYGDDERYELIGEVEAKPDRAIIYRGRLLHSGHIPVEPDPDTARESGRLTINTFLVGCP